MRHTSHSPATPAPARSEQHNPTSRSSGVDWKPCIVKGAWQTAESRAMPSMQSKVRQAVAALQDGRSLIVGRYPDGVYREIVKLEDLRDSLGAPKGLLAVATRYNAGKEAPLVGLSTFTLVYFPTSVDAATYYRAGTSSYRAGPADLYPGSVGALEIVHDLENGLTQIVQLQSSVKIADPSVSELLKQPGKSLCTRYQKWSSRLLEQAFKHIRRLKISQIAIAARPETDLPLSTRVRNFDMICRKAETCGFTLSADRSLLIDTSFRK